MLAQEVAREFHDLRILGWKTSRMFLTDRRDRRFRHALAARRARLRAPHVHRVELPSDNHCGEHAHAVVELALEAYVGAQMHHAVGERRTMKEHREGAMHSATTLDD